MPANKEFTKLANQLSQLAKFYLSHLNGSAADVTKKEKSLLSHVRKSHNQLRVKGTSLIRASGNTRTFDDSCPSGTYRCADGTCVPSSDCCDGERGLTAESVGKAKPAAKKAAKKLAKKK